MGVPMAIIAECGTAHCGSMNHAVTLMDLAKEAGADGVKFQAFWKHEPLFCELPGDENRKERWNASALSYEEWRDIQNWAGRLGLKFGLSVFQQTGVHILQCLEPDFVKVASRAALTFPYDELEGPFLISTGMISTEQRRELVSKLNGTGKHFSFLHCVSKYPTPLEDARWPGNGDGLSDHSGNPWVAIDALSRGCKTIEVHFGAIDGPDAAVSLNSDQLKMICEARDAFAQMRPH